VKQDVYECGYVLWWLAAIIGASIVALVAGFPHTLSFVPAVSVWLVLWTLLGFWIDRRTSGRFGEGAFPFEKHAALFSGYCLLAACGLSFLATGYYRGQPFMIQIAVTLLAAWIVVGILLNRATNGKFGQGVFGGWQLKR
jgi:hypothetical protein